MGDPRDPDTQIGPLVSASAAERVAGMVEDAVSHGAQVVSGGEPDGPLFPPTVLKGVTPEMRVYGEESFGPVVGIIDVDGPDEAVAVANDTEYGLAAAVFGATCPRRSTWPAGSRAASATSTARPCTTRRRCRSAE